MGSIKRLGELAIGGVKFRLFWVNSSYPPPRQLIRMGRQGIYYFINLYRLGFVIYR